jgi:hypothetical protein
MPIEHLIEAFQAVFGIKTLALMSLGVAAGLIAGAIPGFTIAMAVVLTLPFTFGMEAIQGLATMLGVFVGGLSGPVGRPHVGDADRHPRHPVLGRHHLRRLPHGPPGPAGAGARHRRVVVVLRRPL